MAWEQLAATEFIRHYAETWVRVKLPSKEWQVAFFRTGEWGSPTNIPLLLNIDGKDLRVDLNAVEFDTSMPKSGLYTSTAYGCPLIVNRSPNRQWKWGLTRANTDVQNVFANSRIMHKLKHMIGSKYEPNQKLTGAITFHALRLDTPIAKDILFPTYSPYKEGWESLKEGDTICSVFSTEWMGTPSPVHNGFLLWRQETIVAQLEFSGDRVQVKVVEPMFNQEVIDFYSRNGVANVEITY